jgi:hypothetical protein
MPRRLRCAIYTRKSSEEGLDMEFNSLDAQREAGPVPVLCRSFDHILCSKGDEPWAQAGRMNFAKKRCV